MGIRHLLAHMLGYNLGTVETFWRGDKLMVCFRCDACGQISNVHDSDIRRIVREEIEKGVKG